MRAIFPVLMILILPMTALAAARYLALSGQGYQQARAFDLAQYRGQPVLLLFWRDDCAPCLVELQQLYALAAAWQHPMALIALHDANLIRPHLPPVLPANVTPLVDSAPMHATFAEYGDGLKALPFSVALHADGTRCGGHYGGLGIDQVTLWSHAC